MSPKCKMAVPSRVLVWCVFLVTLSVSEGEKPTRLFSVTEDALGNLQVVEGMADDPIVHARFSNEINSTGWAYFMVEGNSSYDDHSVALGAGYVEGVLTAELIQMQWNNTMAGFCNKPSSLCNKLIEFIRENLLYMEIMVEKYSNVDPFWYQVMLFITQLEGLSLGYNTTHLEPINYEQLFLMQLGGDLDALQSALSDGKQPESEVIGSGKCSALIKLLPGNADLYVSHDTWDEYQSMLRIYKLYDLPYFVLGESANETVPGHRVSFSSYPGVLYSGDDFYQLSSRLVTTETTFGNSNPALWKYIRPQCVFEGIRNVVANRLATSGKEWCDYFSMYNSGTYNNQWMVVDYNKFKRGQTELQDGLLYVLEQLPGKIHQEDLTDVLRQKSYWPSFNIPYFPDIFNMSGFAESAAKYGSWFTWTGSPRALIFARNHSDVVDMTSMIDLMRYNNFQHDPLSQCNCTPPYSGENAVSARSDLNPANGTYPFGALGHRCHGGTDNKVTSSTMMENVVVLPCMATSGPTHRQQPVFQWSTSGFSQPLGHPDKWDFDPVLITW